MLRITISNLRRMKSFSGCPTHSKYVFPLPTVPANGLSLGSPDLAVLGLLKYYVRSLLLIIQSSIACLFTFICSAYIINTLCVHVHFHAPQSSLYETEVRYLYNTAKTLLTLKVASSIFTGIKYTVFTYTRLSIIYLYR